MPGFQVVVYSGSSRPGGTPLHGPPSQLCPPPVPPLLLEPETDPELDTEPPEPETDPELDIEPPEPETDPELDTEPPEPETDPELEPAPLHPEPHAARRTNVMRYCLGHAR
jgi:hypothetical protein